MRGLDLPVLVAEYSRILRSHDIDPREVELRVSRRLFTELVCQVSARADKPVRFARTRDWSRAQVEVHGMPVCPDDELEDGRIVLVLGDRSVARLRQPEQAPPGVAGRRLDMSPNGVRAELALRWGRALGTAQDRRRQWPTIEDIPRAILERRVRMARLVARRLVEAWRPGYGPVLLDVGTSERALRLYESRPSALVWLRDVPRPDVPCAALLDVSAEQWPAEVGRLKAQIALRLLEAGCVPHST